MIYITVDLRYFTEAWLGVAELHYNSKLQASGKDISGEDIYKNSGNASTVL